MGFFFRFGGRKWFVISQKNTNSEGLPITVGLFYWKRYAGTYKNCHSGQGQAE